MGRRQLSTDVDAPAQWKIETETNWKEKKLEAVEDGANTPKQVVYACTRAAARTEALQKTTASHVSFAKHAELYTKDTADDY